MHNCKSIRTSFVELAGEEIPPARSRQLLAEVNACAACREEYAGVKSAVHVSGQALRSSRPAETFWPAYHERLKSRLAASQTIDAQSFTVQTSVSSRLLQTLRSFVSSSVRVPVPAAAALLLLMGMAIFVLRPDPHVPAVAQTNPLPAAEIRTVEVPVVQQKVVTRVVYVNRKTRASERFGTITPANAVARALRNAPDHAPLSLVDFKPADEVKLTVIKGGYRDEK
ncbi:MAG TPA: hypothetical protein VIW64_13435 [Pyrinomonadaceae bacterium]|jgi:hypothetical protein